MKWKKYVPDTLCIGVQRSKSRNFLTDGGLHTLMGLGKTDSDSIKSQCARVVILSPR